MKNQWLNRGAFFLLVLVFLIGSGIVIRTRSGVSGADPVPISNKEVKKAFESNNFSRIRDELNKILLDQKALDNNSIINEVVSVYNSIDKIPVSESEKISLKKKIMSVLLKSRVPLSKVTLKKISLIDKNPDIRHLAGEMYDYKRSLTLSERIDTRKYIIVDGKGMTYEQAYPIIVDKVHGSSIKEKNKAIKLLSRYGTLIRNKPVIEDLINMYHATPIPQQKLYKEYSGLEKKRLALKSNILLAVAISGNPSGKDLLTKAKASANRPIRRAADNIETLLTTGALHMSAQPHDTQTSKGETEKNITY